MQANDLRGLLTDGLRDVEAAAARCAEVEEQMRDMKNGLAAKALAIQTCLAAIALEGQNAEALAKTTNSTVAGALAQLAALSTTTTTTSSSNSSTASAMQQIQEAVASATKSASSSSSATLLVQDKTSGAAADQEWLQVDPVVEQEEGRGEEASQAETPEEVASSDGAEQGEVAASGAEEEKHLDAAEQDGERTLSSLDANAADAAESADCAEGAREAHDESSPASAETALEAQHEEANEDAAGGACATKMVECTDTPASDMVQKEVKAEEASPQQQASEDDVAEGVLSPGPGQEEMDGKDAEEEAKTMEMLAGFVEDCPEWHPTPSMLEVYRPVGLQNRGNDCFWLAALQCLRHSPGLTSVLSAALPPPERPAATVSEALARLFSTMSDVGLETGTDVPPIPSDATMLEEFRLQAMTELSGGNGAQGLVQYEKASQKQQDTHEFLCQLLDCLGHSLQPHEDWQPSSPRGFEQQPGHLEALEKELLAARNKQVTACLGRNPQARRESMTTLEADQAVNNILYEYSMVQWAGSTTRMASRPLSTLLEGQRLAQVHCEACGRYAVSGAEPFTVEEIKLTRHSTSWLRRLGGLFGASSSPIELSDLVRRGSRTLSAEGYRCGNAECGRVGTSIHTMKYLRLPSILILHINRAEADGSRCEVRLSFPQCLDLGECGAVAHFGSALDRNLEPCSTSYRLVGAVFHRGRSSRSGHYFACVRHDDKWVSIDDATTRTMSGKGKESPMALEMSEWNGGSRAVLLFYAREV